VDWSSTTFNKWWQRRIDFNVRMEMFTDKIVQKTTLTAAQRIKIAGQVLRDAVVVNLSRPVRKYKSKITKRITVDPESRSKPGEFPRADTTRLKNDIYARHYPEQAMSRIGTTLLYGLVLETRLDRSFLRRTLNEQRARILLIVQGNSHAIAGLTETFQSLSDIDYY